MKQELDLAAEIRKLRRENRVTRWVGALLVALLVASLAVQRARFPKTIEATQLLLKDNAGNVVARLGQMDFGGTCLTLTAKAHVADAELCVHDDDSSMLPLLEQRGDSRVSLSPGFNTYEPPQRFPPGLYIGEDLGKNYVNLSLGAETKLVFGHRSNESIVISSPADKPAISLFDAGGKKIWQTR